MLIIVSTHPIQYQVPLWQALAKDGRVPFEVWYLTEHGVKPSLDREFGKTFAWDIELLSGYPYRFLAAGEGVSPTEFWNCKLRESLRGRFCEQNVKAVWIQGWQVLAYWQVVRQAKSEGVEVWLRGESNDLKKTAIYKQCAKRLLLKILFSKIDRFFYIGAANKRLYENYGVPQQQLYPALYSVDNARFAAQVSYLQPNRLELRRHWKIADDAFCVLFCGKFIDKKRPLDLIQAAQILKSDGRIPKLHLLFVGSGELGREMRMACRVVCDLDSEGRASDHSTNSHIGPIAKPRASFAGFLNQQEISRAYVAADCLVLPSDQDETWGLVVNEALASGLPCLVSSACGSAEDLACPPIGKTFPVGDSGALANQLDSISRDLPSRDLIEAKISKFHFNVTVDSIVDAYQSVTGRQRRS
jgi:glycosyltransferase involved in cell wall biosynthesis